MKKDFLTRAEMTALVDSLSGEWRDLALLVLLSSRPAGEVVLWRMQEVVPLVLALAESFRSFDCVEGPLFPKLSALPRRLFTALPSRSALRHYFSEAVAGSPATLLIGQRDHTRKLSKKSIKEARDIRRAK